MPLLSTYVPLFAANAKVDGQPLKRQTPSITATGELPRGDAGTSKVGEVEDAIPAAGHDLGLATLEDDMSFLGKFMDVDEVLRMPFSYIEGEW